MVILMGRGYVVKNVGWRGYVVSKVGIELLGQLKIPHHFRQAFWYRKGVRYHQKNFKIGTLEDFEKSYVLYVAMAKKPLSSG